MLKLKKFPRAGRWTVVAVAGLRSGSRRRLKAEVRKILEAVGSSSYGYKKSYVETA